MTDHTTSDPVVKVETVRIGTYDRIDPEKLRQSRAWFEALSETQKAFVRAHDREFYTRVLFGDPDA